MENIVAIFVGMVSIIFGQVNVIVSFLSDPGFVLGAGSSLVLALAVIGEVRSGDLNEEILNNAGRWHGSMNDKFFMIDNLLNKLVEYKSIWGIPSDVLDYLIDKHAQLDALMKKCASIYGSTADRRHRNALLKSVVGYCLSRVKFLVLGLYSEEVITREDVHDLGFLIPGEASGVHKRKEPTKDIPLVKVKIVNEDAITVIVDQSVGEDAAKVVRGWPRGVKFALIVILASDGVTEIIRVMTSKIYNDIRMPNGSHGKQFLIKVSFLIHVDDEPLFGTEQIFAMPLTAQDLIAALDKQSHENFEARVQETEQQRLEIERLQAELKKLKEKE